MSTISRTLLLLVALMTVGCVIAVDEQGQQNDDEVLPVTDNLQLWLSADDGIVATGSLVETWMDKSGYGNHAIASLGSDITFVENQATGCNAVRFTGSDSSLMVHHSDQLNADSAFTAFVVFSYDSGFRIAQKKNGYGASSDAWFLSPQQGLSISGVWYDDKKNGWLFEPSTDSLHLMSCTFNGQEKTVSIYGNGQLLVTIEGVQPQEANEDPLYIGRRNASTGGNLAGDIAEIIIYNATLSEEQRVSIEDYLMTKYGL
ncbi:MAG: hypothetical protein PHH90_08200 [Limnochordia bacterium]|nr:hypothetical protein [Limnochordia bacterium]